MNLDRRVRALEKSRDPGRCTLCNGHGRASFLRWYEGEPKPVPPGCERCGRVASPLKVMVLTREDEPCA